MCGVCGCQSPDPVMIATPEPRQISLAEVILHRNDHAAAHNREHFQRAGVLALNLLSSPGSGKTALLERTLRELPPTLRPAAIVGDLATDRDAQRLQATGAPAIQIETGELCHLEADLVHRACHQLDLSAIDILFIENVGNLVCPAAFDLGEERRVLLLSVTEGEDKPLKYPSAFSRADLVLITKVDLAEAVEFDQAAAIANLRAVNPTATILSVSSRRGQGWSDWLDWLQVQRSHLLAPVKA
ncbi:hydrogenase nickel incorporation protein HypB [Synechococcus elongatus]|uniref:hydrogenase nickel incorporation protein HypB n=1 Tax=Synechococcus elongatus TaxID=32046 RepID=UPI000F7D9A5F|nr:hydrogenase nickel incorporation protein HypB [Synechococcus elongatus]